MSAGHYHLHLHNLTRSGARFPGSTFRPKPHHPLAAMAYRHGLRVDTRDREPPRYAASAEAASAYRRAARHGTGDLVFDYRGKVGVTWTGILAPDDAPDWARDPVTLWRRVDAAERRKDARFAREVIIGLPCQVDLAEHRLLVERFVRAHCLPRRLIADIAIHAPPTHHGGDPRNWHAHILLTDRPIGAQGFAPAKDRATIRKDMLLELRQGWTRIHNGLMRELGLPHRIDDRTLAAQLQEALARGEETEAVILDRLPQIHLGKAVHARHPLFREFAGRRERNRIILAENSRRGDRCKDRLDIALHHQRQAAFTEQQRAELLDGLPPVHAYDTLHRVYGRPDTWRHRLLQADIIAAGARAMADHGWLPAAREANAEPIRVFVVGMVRKRGAGYPLFTVTARDFAFLFFRLGLTDIVALNRQLEDISREEEAHRWPWVKPLTWSELPAKRPTPRPEGRRLVRLEVRAARIAAEAARRHGQELAFERRYLARTRPPPGRQPARSRGLGRTRQLVFVASGVSNGADVWDEPRT